MVEKTEVINSLQYQELLKKGKVNKKGRITTMDMLPEYKDKIIVPIFNKEIDTLTIDIPFRLPNLNDYINSERTHWSLASTLKKNATEAVKYACRDKRNIIDPNALYDFSILWIVPNNKEDPDNVYQGIKYLLDGIVKAGIIKNDGRKNVRNIFHSIQTIKDRCVIVVTLKKVNNNETK